MWIYVGEAIYGKVDLWVMLIDVGELRGEVR